MGSWNYRVVKKKEGQAESIGIYSVYYNDEGHTDGVSLTPEFIVADSVEDVEGILNLMKEALDKPILYWDEI